jgi:hypothetical protein
MKSFAAFSAVFSCVLVQRVNWSILKNGDSIAPGNLIISITQPVRTYPPHSATTSNPPLCLELDQQ